MQKDFKNEIDTQYNDVFKNLYVQWHKQIESKYEELQSKKVFNSGKGLNAMYMLMEELINKSIYDLQQLFSDLPTKYNREIPFEEINEYKEKTINNLYSYINNMEKELTEKYKSKTSIMTETNEIFLNNLKENSKNKIEKIFDGLVNLKKGKKTGRLGTIIGILIGFAGLIAGIISIIK